MKKITLKVDGITCGGCVSKIRDCLNKNNDIAITEVLIDEKLPGPLLTKIEKLLSNFTLYFFIRFNMLNANSSYLFIF